MIVHLPMFLSSRTSIRIIPGFFFRAELRGCNLSSCYLPVFRVCVFVSLMRVFRLLYVLLLFSISMFRYGTAMTNSYCDSHFPTV